MIDHKLHQRPWNEEHTWLLLGSFKFENNKNTKCPIDALSHCHCRRDPRITKDCIELLQVLRFWVFFDFGKKKAEKFLAKVTSFFISFRFSSSPSVDHLASEEKEMSLADRFKNFYRGQLFKFCLRRRRFFSSKFHSLRCLLLLARYLDKFR